MRYPQPRPALASVPAHIIWPGNDRSRWADEHVAYFASHGMTQPSLLELCAERHRRKGLLVGDLDARPVLELGPGRTPRIPYEPEPPRRPAPAPEPDPEEVARREAARKARREAKEAAKAFDDRITEALTGKRRRRRGGRRGHSDEAA